MALATNDLEPGVGNLSLKAINKLLPHLKAGLIYSDARVKAGYDYQKASIESIQKLPAPPVIPNPVVTRALHEARRVINAVIATHGKPDIIRIEIPREVKHGKKRLDKYKKQQNKNASANRQAEQSYESIRLRHPNLHLPQNMKGDDRLKYRLWQEQKEQCIYTGRSIGMQQLFSAATEVDHILPRSRTVNDSYMNKVLCFAEPNATKGNRTPYECWGGTETYEDILSRVDASLMPFAKRKAMMKKSLEPLETFINSQLTDTSYISREVLSYVQVLGCDVSVVKGTATSWLRHQWGLNSVLGSVEKNREDHRHHFIDAVVVACTNRALYQGVAKAAKPLETHEEIKNKLKVPLPWPTLRESIVGFSEDLIVSYSPQHKVIGAFHEQTAYGVQIDPQLGTERVVYRKPLDSSISISALKDIADPALKKAIYKHLEAHGNDPKIAFSKENPFYFNDNQAPVRHLRLIKSKRFNKNSFLAIRDCNGKPYRYHLYGNNHHVEIFFNHITSKYDSRFVNTFEAAQRARNTKLHRAGDHIPESVCDPKWDEDHEFLMHLHTNDLLELDYDGQRIIYRVLSLDPSANRIVLMPATMAIKNTKAELRKTINSIFDKFNPRKVVVNSLGRIIYVKEGGRGK